ncbi:MAG: NUDIX hydrolase [Bacteroidales bacterium]|nr:NUDIX hydrolase [Bacteroidales bacterium]
MMTNLPRLAVRAIITDDQKQVLILKRSSTDTGGTKWCLPGGKIEYGETAEEALKKEILEEVNLECISTDFLFFIETLPGNYNEEHYITLIYECKVKGNLRINNESSDYYWLNKEDITKYSFAFYNDKAIVQYFEIQGKDSK